MTIFNKFFKNHLTISQATDLFEEVKSQTHPDINDLERLVNFHKAPIGTNKELQALNLKYRAMTHVPTTIEKTMTPAQLYEAGCPLWCANYSIEQLSYYFTMTFESPTGAQIIQYMENSVIPSINSKNFFNHFSTFSSISMNGAQIKLPPDLISHRPTSGLTQKSKTNAPPQ